MSFILDALKKSENERKRTIGPSLVDAPIRRPRSDRPWWAVAVAALLIVNLGVLIIVLARKGDSSNAQPVPAGVAAPAATPPAPIANRAPPAQDRAAVANSSPTVRSLAEEAATDEPYPDAGSAEFEPPSNPALAAAAAVPDGPPIVRPIDAPSVAPLGPRSAYESRSAAEALPTLSTLIGNGASLPDLKLDIHVYSSKPAERFVFVNMRKYQEGQTLSEGPVIERITAEGAILNQQGQRFLLPRQ